ncbi:hypothetical protein CEXT_578161 [Caerostris extrusa]|uniref:Uncharacterized protein n=1 Tax=Caerostris extrusa TaxID=172846 RepID=A0AAV4Y5S0_CAEEX|nr:hypothetical protein CEXT_578161 [Caerostris extrusa]
MIYEEEVCYKSNDWPSLLLLWDEGLYECQVSSDPKISLFVNLSIVVAKASILWPSPTLLEDGELHQPDLCHHPKSRTSSFRLPGTTTTG